LEAWSIKDTLQELSRLRCLRRDAAKLHITPASYIAHLVLGLFTHSPIAQRWNSSDYSFYRPFVLGYLAHQLVDKKRGEMKPAVQGTPTGVESLLTSGPDSRQQTLWCSSHYRQEDARQRCPRRTGILALGTEPKPFILPQPSHIDKLTATDVTSSTSTKTCISAPTRGLIRPSESRHRVHIGAQYVDRLGRWAGEPRALFSYRS